MEASLDRRARYDLAQFGGAVGDPSRAAMLVGLLGGVALPASGLARLAKVAPSTASGHLRVLEDAGLVVAQPQGRHRYYALAGPDVADMVEKLVAMIGRSRPPRGVPQDEAFVVARTCYGHLAGKIAVALWTRANDERWVVWSGETVTLLPKGRDVLATQGLVSESSPFPTGKRCLDWSERLSHVSGPLGVEIFQGVLDRGWVRRVPGGRTLRVTERGLRGFHALGLQWRM
jgi:DNA-binding transcriptional ArsR family regulator